MAPLYSNTEMSIPNACELFLHMLSGIAIPGIVKGKTWSQSTVFFSTYDGIEERAQWLARRTSNDEVVSSSPIKGPRCFLEQGTLPLLLSTGWFQERIRA